MVLILIFGLSLGRAVVSCLDFIAVCYRWWAVLGRASEWAWAFLSFQSSLPSPVLSNMAMAMECLKGLQTFFPIKTSINTSDWGYPVAIFDSQNWMMGQLTPENPRKKPLYLMVNTRNWWYTPASFLGFLVSGEDLPHKKTIHRFAGGISDDIPRSMPSRADTQPMILRELVRPKVLFFGALKCDPNRQLSLVGYINR